jgi:hypothetical protein
MASGQYDVEGGALYAQTSDSTVADSTFTANVAAKTGSADYVVGGAIYDDDGISIMSSVITGNSATMGGGGVYADDPETITRTVISGNTVSAAPTYYGGGGVEAGYQVLTLIDSTISGNSVAVTDVDAGGGGVYNDSGLSMNGTTISGNTVTGTGSGIGGGGGIYNDEAATIENSTIASNHSSINGGGIESMGNYVVDIVNDTLYENGATHLGGNIDNPGALTLTQSIVGGGTAATGKDIDNGGTLTSGDYNIIETNVVGNALAGTTTHDLKVDPKLLALAGNGGPTHTAADQSTSPGKADIPYSGGCGTSSLTIDQRGYTRGANGRCDIGAYEFGGVATSIRPKAPAVRGGPGHHSHHSHHPGPASAARHHRTAR